MCHSSVTLSSVFNRFGKSNRLARKPADLAAQPEKSLDFSRREPPQKEYFEVRKQRPKAGPGSACANRPRRSG
jgi:hypothetical protein